MLAAPIRRLTSLLTNSRLGWVGMDIHRTAVHLARVQRVGSRFELNATWTAYQSLSPDDSNDPLERMIEQAKKARPLFPHAHAAFTTGDVAVDYREFELEMNDRSEMDQAVRTELLKDPGYQHESSIAKVWEIPTNRRTQSRRQNVAVVATEYSTSMWLGELIARAGFYPEMFDAMPCAIARSVELFLAGADQPCLVAHVGNASTTLSLVHQGIPILTRILSQHGFERVLTPLSEEFAINSAECHSLLLKVAQNAAKAWNESKDLMEVVSEYQIRFVQSIASEIYRTLEYIRTENSELFPTGVVICGDGSVLPDMSLQFEQLLELPTEPWSLGVAENVRLGFPPSLYAVAAGLSATAWDD
jgi:Tfp pilus assembly PilM family ATPase